MRDTPSAACLANPKSVAIADESPPLRCDKAEKRHCYTDCPEKDQKDCYAPSASVDAVCESCTGKYVSIRFFNNANNVQLLLPMSIEINQETLFISYITDFAALCGGLCKPAACPAAPAAFALVLVLVPVPVLVLLLSAARTPP